MTSFYKLPSLWEVIHNHKLKMQKNLYSHLMNGCYELKEEHAHDVKELMIEAFITNNKIWSSANLNRK